ncbi:MAG: DUF4921 family protein [Candidatus Liptonbacteria bacterium]
MSQFRKDLVSGEWIIIAPERAKRPHDKLMQKEPRVASPVEQCPFEKPAETGNWPPYLALPDAENWRVMILPNKYPALTHGPTCPVVEKEGLYELSEGTGYHDLLVFRDHATDLTQMPQKTLTEAFIILQERCRMLAIDPCSVYTSTFFNWGESAGASLTHPHFQILTLPIIPPHILHSLKYSATFFEANATCVHCAMIEYEKQHAARVVAENGQAIAFAPFASRQPFEIKIFPKKHSANFEETEQEELSGVVEILQKVLSEIKEHLNDPDLNFFIHTSPLKHKPLYGHYHWHIEIIPKISTPAGFELSTGVLIDIVAPEAAAALLRGEETGK